MKSIVAKVVMVMFLVLPGMAKAQSYSDNFNDNDMNTNLWEFMDFDPDAKTNLIEQGGRLEWITTPGWSNGYDADKHYASKWAFDLNHDFECSVQFHYDYRGESHTDEGAVHMGLIDFKDDVFSVFQLGAGNQGGNRTFSSLETQTNDPLGDSLTERSSWWNRGHNNGFLQARYDASEDELTLTALEKIVTGGESTYTPVGASDYEGLRTSLGISQVSVFLGGWSEGAALGSGKAYLDDFQVINGTITPEPISSILFIIGSAVFGLAGYKKRKHLNP